MDMNPNVIINCDRAFVANPAAVPTQAGQTVVLFSTHPRKPGGSGTAVTSTFVRSDGTQAVQIAPDSIEQVKLIFTLHDKASAANGLRAYVTYDRGATWYETDLKGYVGGVANQPSIGAGAAIQVPVLSAGQEWAEEFDVGAYPGLALEYVTGATAPTATTGWLFGVSVQYAQQ